MLAYQRVHLVLWKIPWKNFQPGVGLSQDGLIELQATATYIIDQWGDPRRTLHGRKFESESNGRGKWVTPQQYPKMRWKNGGK
jgi:hypothetical protein